MARSFLGALRRRRRLNHHHRRRTRELLLFRVAGGLTLHLLHTVANEKPPTLNLTTTSTHTDADNGGKFGTTRITNLHILALCTNVASLICTTIPMPPPNRILPIPHSLSLTHQCPIPPTNRRGSHEPVVNPTSAHFRDIHPPRFAHWASNSVEWIQN